ncbi:MAG: fumarate hydratase [Deltaproteobacteria bacterium]|jgi:fumarate hydratase subunit alpha|nr:fumarate hydratase [Deltaproteobacteria bacterium]
MRTLQSSEITKAVKDLAMSASCDLEPDILDHLVAARDREKSPLAKNALEMLITNANIASREQIPVCQDTGIGVVFISVGQEVIIEGDLENAVQEGIRAGYDEGYLRKSVCDPVTRKNTGTNVPAVVHYELEPGDRVHIAFLPKGCGSENMSGLVMLPPSAGIAGVVDYVVQKVKDAGSNPCPPVVVGVGLGGTFEKAALLAKKSLLRPLGEPNPDKNVAEIEQEILQRINREGQGVMGWGGVNTALAVHMETYPTHIASLPVAVNIQCHAHRHKEVEL